MFEPRPRDSRRDRPTGPRPYRTGRRKLVILRQQNSLWLFYLLTETSLAARVPKTIPAMGLPHPCTSSSSNMSFSSSKSSIPKETPMFTFDAPNTFTDLSKLVGTQKGRRRNSSLLQPNNSSSPSKTNKQSYEDEENDAWFQNVHPTHYKIQSNSPVRKPQAHGTRHSTGGSTIASATAAAKKRKSSIMGGELSVKAKWGAFVDLIAI